VIFETRVIKKDRGSAKDAPAPPVVYDLAPLDAVARRTKRLHVLYGIGPAPA
jgi:hypothetical protein